MAEGSMRPGVLQAVQAVHPRLVWLAAGLWPGQRAALARCEAENKFAVMRCVIDPSPPVAPFASRVRAALALDAFAALFTVEGVAFAAAEEALTRGASLAPLLQADLPERSLTMVHAGVGMAAARHALARLVDDPSQAGAAVDGLVAQLRGVCRPGFAGCALESLGLVALYMHGPAAVRAIGRGLDDAELRGWFWHGVGRAVYFSPRNMVPRPGNPWPAVGGLDAFSDGSRADLVSGLAWAVTMVNLRHPEVVDAFLQRHGHDLEEDAFIDGVAGSLVMRQSITPDAMVSPAFVQHPGRAELWQRCIRQPGWQALGPALPVPLEQVFRYSGRFGQHVAGEEQPAHAQ